MTTHEQARDEIQGRFKTQWDADTPAVTVDGKIPPTEYDNLEPIDPNVQTAPWARLTVQHGPGGQATLADEAGVRTFDRFGLVTAQIFVPQGEGVTLAMRLGKIAVDAFEGKKTASDVWFQNVTPPNEVGPSGGFFQVNVVANFRYDEAK